MLLVLIQRLLQTQEYVQVVICMYIYILVSMLLVLIQRLLQTQEYVQVVICMYIYIYIY